MKRAKKPSARMRPLAAPIYDVAPTGGEVRYYRQPGKSGARVVVKCCRTCAWYHATGQYTVKGRLRPLKNRCAHCLWPCPPLPDSADFKFLPRHAMWPEDGTTCACWAERKGAKP